MNEQNNNVNIFRKYRYFFSILFAILITVFSIFLAVIIFDGSYAFGLGIILIPVLIGIFFLSCWIIFKMLTPVTTEEIVQTKILEDKLNLSNKYTSIISWIILLSLLGFALYFCNKYFGFIK